MHVIALHAYCYVFLHGSPLNWMMSSADGLPSLGNSLGLGLQPSLPPNSPHDRGYRPPSAGPGGSASNNALAQISAAQLLPNFCQSLYASNPGAMLGSGQAAGMALGSSTHTGMSSGLNTSSSPLAMGAARYLAGLGMGSGVSFLALHFCTSSLFCCVGICCMLMPVQGPQTWPTG